MRQLDIIVVKLEEGCTIKIMVRGNSMRVYLVHERDYVILQKPESIKVGDVILAEVSPKHYVLHRAVKIDGENITLRGDGNLSAEYCKLSDVKGKAIAFERKGRKIQESVDSLKFRMYSWFWMHTLPLRRYLLYAHHLVFRSRKELYKNK